MAPQIGESLREARTRRGIDLGGAQQATKIRARYLEAMERERWDVLPDPAYVRGFLHTYAQFLGLDADALVGEYARSMRAPQPSESQAEPLADSLTEPLMTHAPGTTGTRLRVSPAVLAGAAVAAVAGFLIVLGLTGGSNGGNQHHGQAASPSTAQGSSTTTQSTTSTAAAPTVVSVRLQPTGTVWVCMVDDRGRDLVNGETLSAGDTRGPFRAKSFKVRLGNGEMQFDVGGKAFRVPPVAEPVGYSITPSGVHRLGSSGQPTCA
jgi:cytoskeleton protein RodZ